MKIDKAISRLKLYVKYRKPDPDDNFHESVQLGIEALKRVKAYKEAHVALHYEPMPGETTE